MRDTEITESIAVLEQAAVDRLVRTVREGRAEAAVCEGGPGFQARVIIDTSSLSDSGRAWIARCLVGVQESDSSFRLTVLSSDQIPVLFTSSESALQQAERLASNLDAKLLYGLCLHTGQRYAATAKDETPVKFNP